MDSGTVDTLGGASMSDNMGSVGLLPPDTANERLDSSECAITLLRLITCESVDLCMDSNGILYPNQCSRPHNTVECGAMTQQSNKFASPFPITLFCRELEPNIGMSVIEVHAS